MQIVLNSQQIEKLTKIWKNIASPAGAESLVLRATDEGIQVGTVFENGIERLTTRAL